MKRPEFDDSELPESEYPTPEYWMDDEEVESVAFNYSTRHPDDWVISGPLGRARGPGRRFSSWEAAERWAREFYGNRFKGRIAEADVPDGTRWAFLVKGPRGN